MAQYIRRRVVVEYDEHVCAKRKRRRLDGRDEVLCYFGVCVLENGYLLNFLRSARTKSVIRTGTIADSTITKFLVIIDGMKSSLMSF